MKKRMLVILLAACLVMNMSISIAYDNPFAVSANADEEIPAKEFHYGTVVGKENCPCYYYTTPKESDENIVGFFYPGAQVKILELGEKWCYIVLGREGYIQTSHLSISPSSTKLRQTVYFTSLPPIGFAFVNFSLNDPDIENDGFIGLLLDCDTTQGGDPLDNGSVLKLIGYAGDLIQVQKTNFDGFIRKKHASILLFKDLFAVNSKTYLSGTYQEGADLESGLYRAASNGIGNATIRVSDGTANELLYELSADSALFTTLYIPQNMTIDISANGVLTPILYENTLNHEEFHGGRILSGVDAYIDLPPDGYYSIIADNTKGAYYIISTIWNDKLLKSGKRYDLQLGQEERINVRAGNFIELHNCRLEKVTEK
ncbi:MAG: SH3 domain-containing protein [Candidatus Limiplasma sp.]|nr:SH3 domain-containing protein [Candidatus Limiplasma sp.]